MYMSTQIAANGKRSKSCLGGLPQKLRHWLANVLATTKTVETRGQSASSLVLGNLSNSITTMPELYIRSSLKFLFLKTSSVHYPLDAVSLLLTAFSS